MNTGDFGTLLAHAKNHDEKAVAHLYEISIDRIYRFVYHRTLDTVFTEDIVSEVYMKFLKKISSLHGTTEAEFFSWMFRIAYTTMIDAIRLRGEAFSLDVIEQSGVSVSHATDIDNREKLREVEEFLTKLSERERSIITMRIWDDMPYEDISLIMGESVANVKQIVSRTLTKIAANIQSLLLFVTFFDVLGKNL